MAEAVDRFDENPVAYGGLKVAVVRQSDGTPLAGAEVVLYENGIPVASAATDPDGVAHFLLLKTAPGTGTAYTVSALYERQPGSYTPKGVEPVTVMPDPAAAIGVSPAEISIELAF